MREKKMSSYITTYIVQNIFMFGANGRGLLIAMMISTNKMNLHCRAPWAQLLRMKNHQNKNL